MTDTVAKPRRIWMKRLGKALFLLAVILCALYIVARIAVRTSIGHNFIEKKIESMAPAGQSFDIDGISGDLLGRFEIENITVSDSQSVWMKAEDITLAWSPMALLRKKLIIDDLSVKSADVLQKPMITPAENTDSPTEFPLKSLQLNALSLPRIFLAKDVAGRDITLRATGSANHNASGGSLTLDASTVSAGPQDSADIDLQWSPKFILKGDAKIVGESGGIISGLLNLGSDEAVYLDVDTSGSQADLTTMLSGRLGEREFLSGDIKKTADAASIALNISPETLPRFAGFTDILGGAVTVKAAISDLSDDATIDAWLTAPKLDIDLRAEKSERGYAFPKLTLTAQTPLGAFPDIPVAVYTVELTGAGALHDGVSFDGRLDARSIKYDSYSLDSLAGPLGFTLKNSRLAFDTNLTGVSKSKLGNPKLKAAGRYDFLNKSVRLIGADIKIPGLSIDAKGQASLLSQSADLTGQFDVKKGVLDLALPADISGAFTTRTEDGNIALNLNGTARNVDALPAPLPALVGTEAKFKAKAIIDADLGIIVQSLTAEGSNVKVSGSGQYNFDGALKADATYSAGSFEIGGAKISSASGAAMASGTLDALNFGLNANVPDLKVSGRALTDVEISVDGKASGSAVNADVDISGASESGPISLNTLASYSGGVWELSQTRGNLGDLTIVGDISGRGADIGQLTGKFKVAGNPSAFVPATSVDLDIALSESIANISGDITSISAGPLTGGTLSLDASGPRHAVRFNAELSGDTQITGIERPLNLAANGIADLGAPGASLTTDITGSLGRYTLENTAPVKFAQTELGIKGSGALNLLGGALAFELTDQPQSLTIKTDAIKISDIMPLLGRPGIEGSLGFDADMRVTANGVAADVKGDMQGVRQAGSDAAPLNASLTGTILNNLLSVEVQSTTGALSGQANLGGTVSTIPRPPYLTWPPATALTGDAKASGNIGPLAELFLPPETNVSGGLNMEMQYSVPLDKRGINGNIAMTGGAFEQGTIGLILKDISFASVFTGKTVTVTQFTANDKKGGSVTGNGNIDLDDTTDSAVNLVAKKLHVLSRREGFAVLSGDLKLGNRNDKVSLTGELIVDDATVNIDKISSGSRRPTLDVNFKTKAEAEDEKVETATLLDLSVSSPSRIALKGRGVNATMSLDTKITGAFDDPVLSGEANVTRGRFDFLGKRFDLTESSVSFNSDIMQSRLNVAAIRETSDLTASIKVTGTIDRPEIALESTPQLPEDEVISRILFGRSASQLTAIETARLAAALAQLSGGGGFDLLGDLESALGLDTLDFSQSESGETQLTTGKYLSDNVYVEVRGAAEGTPGLAVEWTPRKNISVEAETAPGETQRVSVQWQKDFD